MTRLKTFQELFKRVRQPGDLVFAIGFLALSVFLLSNLGAETKWTPRTKLFAQPAFWPAVSLIGMTGFAVLHWIGSISSPRIFGRLKEVAFWLRSAEYALWFMVYVAMVPLLGYLLATILFTVCLTLRSGYRSLKSVLLAALVAIVIVVLFKSLLQVKIPGGAIYEWLPDGLRSFMLTYL